MANIDQLPVTLIDVITNTVILRQLAPYIPIRSLLNLSATNKALREFVFTQPEPWRHLDLTNVRSAIIESSPIDIGGFAWRAERMDESLTEEDFYAGPLRGILGRLHSKRILRNVQTLILDGLSVPADLVREIVAEDRYNVRILSLRESNNLNQSKLQKVLRYITRPTRAEGTPRLRSLYFFGPRDSARPVLWQQREKPTASLGVMESEGAQIGAEWNRRSSAALGTSVRDDESRWYGCTGRVLTRPLSDWPETLQACKGLVNFDAVLCRGPRHDITKVNSEMFLQPAIATVALGERGCEVCGSCPEGPAVFGESPEYTLPLLSPPPTHSSTLRAAQRPERIDSRYPKLILRCEDCLRGRWCERCNRWWCEDCYREPVNRVQRTELQQAELREQLRNDGIDSVTGMDGARNHPVKVVVYSNLCVDYCLVSEMMTGAGSNGMWG